MIELKVDDFENGKVYFHISRQDKEDYDRLSVIGGRRYGKYCLICANYPEVRGRYFFVRGDYKEEDSRRIEVSMSEYLIIFELIKKYNEKFS